MVPNLMIGFGIDQVQAEYVADIRLRNINKEYILKRTQEVDSLEAEIRGASGHGQRPEAHPEDHHRRTDRGEEEVRRSPPHRHPL